MKCVRFRGTSVRFSLCSPLVLLAVHWTGGRTIICPRAARVDCAVCRGLTPRLLGYCAAREFSPEGKWGPVVLAELPPSLIDPLCSYADPLLDPLRVESGLMGMRISAHRSGVRCAWEILECKQGDVVQEISLSELYDSIGRLYQLPSDVDSRCDNFVARFGSALLARHDQAAAVDVLA